MASIGLGEHQIPRESLYDLTFDPNEQHNLLFGPAMPPVLAEMRGRLDRWMRDTKDPLLSGPVKAPHGAEVNDPAGISPKERAEKAP